jgi:hypothetical protein
LPVRSSVVQPSLVFGPGGTSAAAFERVALLPLVPLPGHGDQRIQPVHVDDLRDAILALLESETMPARIPAVGPRCLTLADYLAALRLSLEGNPPRFVHVPRMLVLAAARVGDAWARFPFDREIDRMLERGNCAEVAPIAALLGRMPRDPSRFVEPHEAPMHLRLARFATLREVLRIAIAVLWIVSGIVSLGIWPIADSLALLARCGLEGPLAIAALYGSAMLDLGFGVGTLLLRRRRMLYDTQIAVVLAYSAIVAVCLPEFLLHPFAPIVKNLVVLSALWLLRSTEPR